jgi:GNAT superfamily N-acetyltransferase
MLFQGLRVLPSFRGHGVAKLLSRALVDHAAANSPRAVLKACCHLWADGLSSCKIQVGEARVTPHFNANSHHAPL